ncbi:MAG TPA: alkaline phosphatase D family protein [Chitinophagaceae bacterium]|nr:alkaline phosphatase D family protein [Chitinophagaceae bacterium]
MKRAALVLFLLVNTLLALAQTRTAFISGPMQGTVELRTARIWCEVSSETDKVTITYRKANTTAGKTLTYRGKLGESFNPITFELTGLDFNTTYTYEIEARANHQLFKKSGQFTTTDLWQYRKNFPDFTFLAGSCSYFNEPKVDRNFVEIINPRTPATPYGGDSSIFATMAKEKANFTLWLGDNWYYREVDFGSAWGLNYRASRDRAHAVLQDLWKAMPHYAIWDDHDYGPNNADKSYILKDAAREIFKNYWPNPSFGENGQGIYTKLSYSDVDFFLMDDRWFRTNDFMSSTVSSSSRDTGRAAATTANPDKRMWGAAQMEWLKNALKGSLATFKIIVTGSQALNPISTSDCLQDYPIEFNDLMSFLVREKINGVLFFTGDRHHSEVMKYDRNGTYTLYDVTSSPLTSGVGRVRDREATNPARIPGTLVEAQNYTRVSVTGGPRERVLKVEFLGIKGEKLAEWSVRAGDLRTPSGN